MTSVPGSDNLTPVSIVPDNVPFKPHRIKRVIVIGEQGAPTISTDLVRHIISGFGSITGG